MKTRQKNSNSRKVFFISNFRFTFLSNDLARRRAFRQYPDNYLQTRRVLWGQSLFEVVIAIGVIAIVLVGVVSLSTVSVRNSSYSRDNALATKYAQEGTEWIRQQRDSAWTNISTRASLTPGTIWCLPGSAAGITWPGSPGLCSTTSYVYGTTIFFRDVTLIQVGVDEINSIVVVIWRDSQGTHSVRSATRLTNWNR